MQFMNFSSVFFALFALFSTFQAVYALPVDFQIRDVYDPHITYPTAGSSFKPGQTITVTWDTSIIPSNSTNEGMIVLAKPTADSENLQLNHTLASGFLLVTGEQAITLPYDLPPASNYAIVLFGDSGNLSDLFTIE